MKEVSKSAQNYQGATHGLTPKKAIFKITAGPWHVNDNEIDAARSQ